MRQQESMRMQKKKVISFFIACSFLFSVLLHAKTEEARLVELAKKLKPISDTEWGEIAGAKTSENYEIQQGDNLWTISKQLFGNAYYWPKVWALNSSITNPHILSPKEKLVFTPGTSESLPQLAPQSSSQLAQATTEPKPTIQGPLKEYEKVSQSLWTPSDVTQKMAYQNYDEFGLEKEIKIQFPSKQVFRVPAIINDSYIPYLGKIVSSRREGSGLSQHEVVFLNSESQDLQVGTTYSVLSEPEFIRERKSDRAGYVYRMLGEIQVIGVKDEMYIGIIQNAYDAILRGDHIYPLLPLITEIKPTAASEPIEGVVTQNANLGTRYTAQYQFVHLDRGAQDGVQVGNVFRIYDYQDPTTEKTITESDFLVHADALVVHTTAQFCTAMVLRSRDTLTPGHFGILLTDISDLEKIRIERTRDFEEEAPEVDKELDELDTLDQTTGEGLGVKEAGEIKELQNWDKTKDEPQPAEEPTEPESKTNDLQAEPAKPDESKVEEFKPEEPQTDALKPDEVTETPSTPVETPATPDSSASSPTETPSAVQAEEAPVNPETTPSEPPVKSPPTEAPAAAEAPPPSQ